MGETLWTLSVTFPGTHSRFLTKAVNYLDAKRHIGLLVDMGFNRNDIMVFEPTSRLIKAEEVDHE